MLTRSTICETELSCYRRRVTPRHRESPNDDDVAAYATRFATLMDLAESLHIPPTAAEDLVSEILLSSLCRRSVEDLDLWLAGALKHAARRFP